MMLPAIKEVFGSNGSVGDGHFVRYSRKSDTSGIFNGKFQFGDCQNVRYSRKSVIPNPLLPKTSALNIRLLLDLCRPTVLSCARINLISKESLRYKGFRK